MKFWRVIAATDDLPLFASADTREGAIKKVEALTGPLDRSARGFAATQIERADIPEDENVL